MEWQMSQGQPWPYGVTVWEGSESGQIKVNLAFELPERRQNRGIREKSLRGKIILF